MSSWLEQWERELDARLSAFLRNNPVQENLFSEQHLKDRAAALQRQRQQLQGEAKQQRQQLLRLGDLLQKVPQQPRHCRQNAVDCQKDGSLSQCLRAAAASSTQLHTS